jgi:hypothetical protein
MTDPERISKRSAGLSGHLLRAGAAEQPSERGIERTLAALGVAGAIITTTSATSAAGVASAAGATSAASAGGTAKAVSATLLVKWIGIGVVSGVGLAGAAAVVTGPPPAKQLVVAPLAAPRVVVAAAPIASQAAGPSVAPESPAPEATPTAALPPPRVSVAAAAPAPAPAPGEPELRAPLAAEVAFVDRARALLAAGQPQQGLSMLQGYEAQFPEARLLPEVLFLRLETCERLGRSAEARAAAQRLVDTFPQSPHSSKARQLLGAAR